MKRVMGCTGPVTARCKKSQLHNATSNEGYGHCHRTQAGLIKVPNRSIEKKSSQNMQRMGARMTWLMAALWIRWLSLVGTYA